MGLYHPVCVEGRLVNMLKQISRAIARDGNNVVVSSSNSRLDILRQLLLEHCAIFVSQRVVIGDLLD